MWKKSFVKLYGFLVWATTSQSPETSDNEHFRQELNWNLISVKQNLTVFHFIALDLTKLLNLIACENGLVFPVNIMH